MPDRTMPSIEPTEQEWPDIINAAIAETVVQCERRMNSALNRLEWLSPDLDNPDANWQWRPLEELPNYAREEGYAYALICELCRRGSLIFAHSYDPMSAQAHRCTVNMRVPTEDNPKNIARLAQCASPSFSWATCGCILALYKVNVQQYHQLLFPARWITH